LPFPLFFYLQLQLAIVSQVPFLISPSNT